MKKINQYKILRLFGLLIVLCCLSGVVLPQEKAPTADEKRKAEELWEKVIAAKGGRVNLRNVKNLVVSTESYSPSEAKEFRRAYSERFFMTSGKWWAWNDQRPGLGLSIWQYDFEAEIGQEVSDVFELRTYQPLKSPSQILSAEEKKRVRKSSEKFYAAKRDFLIDQLIYLMETKSCEPTISSLTSMKMDGEKMDVLALLLGDIRIQYLIDPKTNLPSQISTSIWFDDLKRFSFIDVLFLENYIEIAGVKFPQVIRRAKNTRTKTTYQVNVSYNQRLFNTPPSVDAGSDAWKP